LVGTAERVVVLTHLWWTDHGPLEDPYGTDPDALRGQRERILTLARPRRPGTRPSVHPGQGPAR